MKQSSTVSPGTILSAMHSEIQPVKILASCGDFSGAQSSSSARLSFPFHRSVMTPIFVVTWLLSGWPILHAAAEPAFGIDHRIPWTTSRVIGSPEPPLPYTVERVFTNIPWRQPMFITAEPGTDRLFVIQQSGDTNMPPGVVEFRDDPRPLTRNPSSPSAIGSFTASRFIPAIAPTATFICSAMGQPPKLTA